MQIPGKLMRRTLELLRDRQVTRRAIYDATGIKLDWLQKFEQRQIDNPSVNTVERLYEFLSGKELEL